MADILIKCMEMPKNCSRCQFCFGANNICPWTREYATSTKRHPDCPLIEVPSHGDLVDINALKLAILDVDYVNKHDYLKGVLNAINHAPTVIEASEVET